MVENNDNTAEANPKKRSRLFGGRKKAAEAAPPAEVAAPLAEAKTKRPAAKKASEHVNAAASGEPETEKPARHHKPKADAEAAPAEAPKAGGRRAPIAVPLFMAPDLPTMVPPTTSGRSGPQQN